MTPKILIVEDDPSVRTALEVMLAIEGFEFESAEDPDRALAALAREPFALVIQDMNFRADTTSGQEGIALYRAIRAIDREIPVLLMTAWTSLETAVALVREGAGDYVAKPWDNAKLAASIRRLLEGREQALERELARRDAGAARRSLASRAELLDLVYASPRMHEVVALAVQVARSDAPVLITGPNGSGKEALADIVHANGKRSAAPMIKVHVGALPDTLFEAELFGAEAGAYTGAAKLRQGRFEAAHGGTLFLDEIGTLSPAGQAKLLRVLQTGEYQRLGSSQTRKADVRVIAATNVDLPRAIADGTFREDLFYRIAVVELAIPPLAERREDVPLLVDAFLARIAKDELDAPPPPIDPAAREALERHAWPGNVRELVNRVHRALLTHEAGPVTPASLGLGGTERLSPPSAPPSKAPLGDDEQAERARIEAALAACGGKISRAAAELGLTRQSLYRRMDRLGLSVERRIRS